MLFHKMPDFRACNWNKLLERHSAVTKRKGRFCSALWHKSDTRTSYVARAQQSIFKFCRLHDQILDFWTADPEQWDEPSRGNVYQFNLPSTLYFDWADNEMPPVNYQSKNPRGCHEICLTWNRMTLTDTQLANCHDLKLQILRNHRFTH